MSTVRTRQTAARVEPVREDIRPAHGRQRVRRSTDKYYIDPSIVPAGFKYQWKAFSVLGMENPQYMAELEQSGWVAVPAERHPGVFLPTNYTGSIIIGGQILMDCPEEFVLRARKEEKMAADQQVRGSREQFGLARKSNGFEGAGENNHPYVRGNTFIKQDMVDVSSTRPKHQLSLDDE